MIYDSLATLGRYRGLHPNLDRALAWLGTLSLKTLPEGRTVLTGDTVYLNRFGYETGDRADAPFETHRRYADIHLPLAGRETIAIADAALHTAGPYDEAGDSANTRGPVECECALAPGRALVVFPGEAHRPGQALGEPCAVQKAVIKVLWD